jgi:TrmH family RNA methyltransferase
MTELSIVLVGTSHPGNIGAVARAMKTMGLRRLLLVNPQRFPSADATARAAGADDVLHESGVFADLGEALVGHDWVVATSARRRHLDWLALGPREFAARVASGSMQRVAVVFGRESSGLSNEELDLCHAVIRIPTDPDFRSLNVASAVQLVGYELLMHGVPAPPASDRPPAAAPVSHEEMEGLYRHLFDALCDIGYVDASEPRYVMRRLRRMLGRTRPDRAELNILRGILQAAQRAARKGAGK